MKALPRATLRTVFHTSKCPNESHPNPKDVKNIDRSGDVYENNGLHDNMTDKFRDFVTGNVEFCRFSQVFGREKQPNDVFFDLGEGWSITGMAGPGAAGIGCVDD